MNECSADLDSILQLFLPLAIPTALIRSITTALRADQGSERDLTFQAQALQQRAAAFHKQWYRGQLTDEVTRLLDKAGGQTRSLVQYEIEESSD